MWRGFGILRQFAARWIGVTSNDNKAKIYFGGEVEVGQQFGVDADAAGASGGSGTA